MIDRPKQKVTSDYGRRTIMGVPGKFHNGLDLRSYTDDFKKRLPVILPEGAIFKEAVWEEMWGWTFKFIPLTSGRKEIRFTHMAGNDKLKQGEVYDKGMKIGYTAVTPYMIKKKLGEHLHFSVWKNQDETENPRLYFKEMGIEVE